MQNLTMDEIKSSELNTLLLFRDFCKENNLKYYLTFGTLLGAVRHKGFIPWDDDVDVLMTRKDYNYLLHHFNKWQKAGIEKREVIAKELVPEFYLNYAKIIDRNTCVIEKGHTLEIGMWIDIFPMDEIPHELFFTRKILLIRNLLSLSEIPVRKERKWYKNLLIRLFHIFIHQDQLLKWYRKLIQKAENTENGNCYTLLYRDFGKIGVPQIPKTMFDPPLELIFEGELFLVPKEYDWFLRECYGDYMIYPPVEKQKSHHIYTCIWKEE